MYDRWQDETVFSDKYDQTHKIIITKYLEHCTLNKLIFKRIIRKFDFSNLVNIISSIFPCVPVFYVFIFLLYTHRQENIFFRHFRNTRNLNPFCRVSAFKKDQQSWKAASSTAKHKTMLNNLYINCVNVGCLAVCLVSVFKNMFVRLFVCLFVCSYVRPPCYISLFVRMFVPTPPSSFVRSYVRPPYKSVCLFVCM